ncbi:MAG: nuclear transport factor 2 family protein [Sedimentisphaerales bacterium]|nr:nuclear transport factor 2 family protein [Sedimentisphaerales bacterium]
MRKTVFAVIVITGAIVLASQAGRSSIPDQVAIEKAVLAAHAKMGEAEEALDAEKFFASIPDFDKGLIIQDGVLFKTRREALDTVSVGFQGVSKIERAYDQTYVTVISPEAALLTGSGTSSVTLYDGRVLTGPFAVSMLFVLRDGRWQLLHGHYSLPNPR